MIDIQILRSNPEFVKDALKLRNAHADIFVTLEKIISIDQNWRKVKKEEELLRADRNKLTMEIASLKKAGKIGKEVDHLIEKSGIVSTRIKEIAQETAKLEEEIKQHSFYIPNIIDKSVTKGTSDKDNVVVKTHGKPGKHAKDVLDHHVLGEKTGWIDFDRGVKLAGHRFSVLSGPVAKLERALINFMLNLQTTNGYSEMCVPHLVNTQTITSTGHLPKFAEQLYKCPDDGLWLIPTAEVPLTGFYANEILEEKNLPTKLCAYTPSYRREAGEYGRDIKGLIRQHQFDKVELVKLCTPESSFSELESLVRDAESVLQALELPYRVIELCTADTGFASAKTYDLEVWLPSQDTYREISSCSNCTDFQARRANIKYRAKDGVKFVHTLNGSGLAVGRTLIAILENYQDKARGVITIPKVLQDYMQEEEIKF
ncbi:MAG: serine--tRNA ligase [Candidatus Micrarchaeota archaeon]